MEGCCLLCNKQTDKKQRRLLQTQQSRHILPVFDRLVRQVFDCEAVAALLTSTAENAFLCRRPCFAMLERILKLSADLKKEENVVCQQLKQAGEVRGMQLSDSPVQPSDNWVQVTPSRKRTATEETRGSPVKKRRVSFGRSTPVRRAIQSIVIPPGASPTAVAVLVKSKNRCRTDIITRASGLKTLARSVGARNRPSIARQVVSDPKLKEAALHCIIKQVQKEMTTMCARKTKSILREGSLQTLRNFSWSDIISDVERNAPTLLKVLQGIAEVKRRVTKSKKSTTTPNTYVVGVCASIFLRHRNTHMNLLQKIISLVLNSGHASKQTYTRLQRLLLCLSHKRTLSCLDILGEDHDAHVHKWCQSIEKTMLRAQQPMTSTNIVSSVVLPLSNSSINLSSATVAPPSSTVTPPSVDTANVHLLSVDRATVDPPSADTATVDLHTATEDPPSADAATVVPYSADATTVNPFFAGASTVDSLSAGTPAVDPLSDGTFDFQDSEQEHSNSDSEEQQCSGSSISSTDCEQSSSTSLSPVSSSSDEMSGPRPLLETYKLVGDNLDKNIRPREMRSDHQTRSLHFFHTYAVHDRVNLSGLSNKAQLPNLSLVDLETLLPSTADNEAMLKNFSILIGRTLGKYMPFFARFGHGIQRHIPHEFSTEMAKKSEVVPLGIILKGEQKYEEMVQVMDILHQYVPTITTTETVTLPDSEETIQCFKDSLDPIILGGDQMTVARARGSKRIRSNAERGKERLEGLAPAIEDWHAKVCLLGVIWKRLYNTASKMDGGSLLQLRNLLNRRNVVKEPSQNVTACEDFFLLIVEAHILSAAMTVFGMSSTDDTPSVFPKEADELSTQERCQVLLFAIKEYMGGFIDITLHGQTLNPDDHVQQYAREVLTLGLLLMEFNDAIHEGDGHRIIRCWRYFLVLFKATKRTNYSIEAFTLLAQHDLLYSPRMAMQLLTNRTINTHGKAGKNIPCDLHLEHLNKEAKNSIAGLGSNITNEAIVRVGKAIGHTSAILRHFDRATGIKEPSGKRSKRSCEKDMCILLKQLYETSKVFATIPGRSHRTFPKFLSNIQKSLSVEELNEWMQQQFQRMLMYH